MIRLLSTANLSTALLCTYCIYIALIGFVNNLAFLNAIDPIENDEKKVMAFTYYCTVCLSKNTHISVTCCGLKPIMVFFSVVAAVYNKHDIDAHTF